MNVKKVYPYWLIILPITTFFIFLVLPSTIGYLYAFTDWNPFVHEISFVGLANFKEIVQNRSLMLAFQNTMIIAFVKTVTVTVVGIALAVMLDRKIRTRNILRSIYFTPAIFSALVVGLIFAGLFDDRNGVINTTLRDIGLDMLALEWLGRRWPAMFVINLAEIWRSLGYSIVITLAALQSIPSDYIDAARVDGANGWQRFRQITLPLIMPAVNVNILFSLIYGLRMFDLVMVLTSGGPGFDTQTFGTLIMAQMARNRYAQSVAINLVWSAILIVVAILFQKYSSKWEADI